MPGIILENWTELPVNGSKEKYDTRSGQFEAYRLFRGPYSERFEFLQNVLPQIKVSNPLDINFTRNYYFYPGIAGMLAHSADISGHLTTTNTGPDSSLVYDTAEILVTYKADSRSFFLSSGFAGTNPVQDTESPVLQTEYQISPEIQTLKLTGDNVQDVDGNRHHDIGDFELQITHLNCKVTYREIPNPDWSSIIRNIGSINNGILFVGDLSTVFPLGSAVRGSVRYDGPTAVSKTVVRTWNAETNKIEWDLAWDITHNLVLNHPHRWNRRPYAVKITDANDVNHVTYLYKPVRLYPYSIDNFQFLRRTSIAQDPSQPDP